jgi:transposase
VVVESTYNWYWLVDGLMEAGYRVHLANPAAIQQYSGLKYTNDQSDARWLAPLLRLGILPEGYIYLKAERAVRDVLRKRAHLVRQHTAQVLSVQNLMVRNTGVHFGAKRIAAFTPAELARLLPNAEHALAVTSSLAVVHCLGQQIKTLEKAVQQCLQHTPAYTQLQTVAGIGPILAQTIGLETGNVGRFPTVGNYASYCRCVGSTKISNGKRKGQGNVNNGNPYLEWAYMEAAQFAIRFSPTVQRFYQRQQVKSHLMIARKAVAHKLARACYDIMRALVPFEVHKAFGCGVIARGGGRDGLEKWFTTRDLIRPPLHPAERVCDRMVESGDASAMSQRKTGPIREPWHL